MQQVQVNQLLSQTYISPKSISIFSTGHILREPGTFDYRWTLYNRGLLTPYQSSKVALASGGAYTLEAGLEIEINGAAWTSSNGTLLEGDIIRVQATSLNEYYVEGVSGTLDLSLTIDGTACTFTLINMVEPASFPYTLPFELGETTTQTE